MFGTVNLSRIRPFCGRILLKLRPGINDLEVVEGDENATKQLNLTIPYGGFAAAGRRSAELQRLPEARVTEGVSIDDYSTWRATRFAAAGETG